ncbi:MAG: class I SAM-dependent methyltransferase [Caldilineaceae bacterium]
MTESINYDEIAGVYAQTRAAAPVVVEALAQQIADFAADAVVVELGCGTGNHSRALAARFPQYQYEGFDQSSAMLHEAQRIPSKVSFRKGDAERHWPYADSYADLVFNVDVIHYIKDLPAFFQEARRVLKTGGTLVIATDSDADLRNRSLTQFFPEILAEELARYPAATALHAAAAAAGLFYEGAESLNGTRPITDEDIANLAVKCSSALRLITLEAHLSGLERVRAAQREGVPWRSCYTLYQYRK